MAQTTFDSEYLLTLLFLNIAEHNMHKYAEHYKHYKHYILSTHYVLLLNGITSPTIHSKGRCVSIQPIDFKKALLNVVINHWST